MKINCSLSHLHDTLLYVMPNMKCWKYQLQYTGCVPSQKGLRVFTGINFVVLRHRVGGPGAWVVRE